MHGRDWESGDMVATVIDRLILHAARKIIIVAAPLGSSIVSSNRSNLPRTATMPSVSLSKVHKHISKKRGAMDSMHENSRDARRLRRAGSREERLSHHAGMTLKARQPYS